MESLPEGLVSTSDKVTSELGGIDAVDVGDIVQLWKAYSTKPSVHEGDTGFRLQNFFWRIWSSKRLSASLTGSTLAHLFLQVSEPRSLKLAFEMQDSDHPSSGLKYGKDHPSTTTTTTSTTLTASSTSAATTAERATVSASASTGKSPLPPILKKSNSSSHGETQKTTRLLLTGLGGQSVTRKPSNPLTPIPPSRPIMFSEQVNRQGQKKAFVVPSKAKGAKRRPVLMRRKSSQQSSACSTRAHSPDSDPPSPVSTIVEPPFEPPDQEDQSVVGSSAEVATQNNKITQPTQPAQRPSHPLDNEEVIVDDTPPEERTSTTTTDYEDLIADPNHKRPFYLFPDEQKEIPPAFLAKLKDLLHKETPLGRLPFRGERPLVGFFSTTACRSFDVRHLSEENYQPPSSYTLVEKDFRTRFAEQKRIAEEYWQTQMAKSLGEGGSGTAAAGFDGAEPSTAGSDNDAARTDGVFSGLDPALPTSTTLGTGTAETVSPSRFGDSQSQGIPTVASSMGTSLLVGNSHSHSHSPGMDTDSFSLIEGPTATAMSYQTPLALSLPQGPSQISLMVQESRRQRLSSSEIGDGLEGESEEETNENGRLDE
ncbi:hypothetical protein BJY00DRAFT_317032 [Aspergillus carlsbadensis]|nr:hypothetical protein BJY00DRAFT_317032 [Aspergillus carlsbadensis]